MQVIYDATARGHVWTDAPTLGELAARLLGFEANDETWNSRFRCAIEALARAGLIVVCRDGNDERVYAAAMHAAELRVARRCSELCAAKVEELPDAASAIRELRAGNRNASRV